MWTGRRAEMGSDAREEEETEGVFEMSTDAWPRPVEDAESDEDDDVSVCPLFTADCDETLPKRNLLSWFSAAPTLPKKRSMPNVSVDGDDSGEEPRQLSTARSGPGGATAAELAWERTARRLGSGDGVFSPEPARALATRGGGFDDTDSESESDFEDVSSSDDEDESRGNRAGFEAETGGTSVEGRASRDSDEGEESFSARVAEALREMRFRRKVATDDAAEDAFSDPAGKTPPSIGEPKVRHFRRVRTARATPSALFATDAAAARLRR